MSPLRQLQQEKGKKLFYAAQKLARSELCSVGTGVTEKVTKIDHSVLGLSAKRLNPKAQTPVSQKLSNPADLRLFSRQHEKESKVQNKWLNHLSS